MSYSTLAAAALLVLPLTAAAGTLADAAAAGDGSPVTIDRALIVSKADVITSDDFDLYFIRDDTRAAAVFGSRPFLEGAFGGFDVGDVVSFDATAADFRGLFELTSPTGVKATSGVSVGLEAIAVTPADFASAAAFEPIESRRAVAGGFEIVEKRVYLGPVNGTVTRQVADGEAFEEARYVLADADGGRLDYWVRGDDVIDSLNALYPGGVPLGVAVAAEGFAHQFDVSEPDVPDYNLLAVPGGLSVVPEPATAALAVGGLALARRRRR